MLGKYNYDQNIPQPSLVMEKCVNAPIVVLPGPFSK